MTLTDIPYTGVKVKGKNKIPSHRRSNQMICTINLCQIVTVCVSKKMKPLFLPFDEINLCNNYILRDPEYIDRFCISFPSHCVLNQVDSDTNLLDNVLLSKEGLTTNRKTKEYRPNQIKIGENYKQKQITPKNEIFRSVSTQLCGESAESSSDEKNVLQQRLFYTNKNLKNYLCINASVSIPILAWKLTKNRLHIINNAPIPGCSQHSGVYQRFKLDIESPSIPEKDMELFY